MTCVPHGALRGASMLVLGLCLALTTTHASQAAVIQGADGADGTNSTNTIYGAGGDGGGNTDSGGRSGDDPLGASAGAAGTSGIGGGGGGGGAYNGAAGGNSDYGIGGNAGTIVKPAGGGGVEAGGGGGFGASASSSGGGGGGGGGQRGLNITATDGIIDIGDTVIGGDGGNGGYGFGNVYADGGGGGGGGIGVVFGGSGVLTVAGSIAGGDGGEGGDGDQSAGAISGNNVIGSYGGSGGAGGTGLVVTSLGATVNVNGAIAGGDGGAAGNGKNIPVRSIPGLGGAGIVGSDITVVLGPDGSISGGLGGDGVTRANAVTLSGAANSFELQADTTSVIGKVVANGTDDVFRLGGTGTRSFDTALLGDQYTGFESFEKVGTGTWSLEGTPGIAADWSVRGGILVLDDGLIDGALDNEATVLASGRISGTISNRAAATFGLNGDLEANSLITNDGLFTASGIGATQSFAVTGGAGFANTGDISLSQGIAGDVLDLSGAGPFESEPDSGLVLDIDLSNSASIATDRLVLGTTSGTLLVSFNPDPSNYGALMAGVLVLQTADGNLQATATGLQDRGLVDYSFEQIGTDWYVTSQLNAAPLGGILAGMQGVETITDAVSRPAALGSLGTPSTTCDAGIYTNFSGGHQGTSDISYGAAQVNLDSGCLPLSGTDTSLRVGLVGAFTDGHSGYGQALNGDTSLHSRTDFLSGYAGIYAQIRSGGLLATTQLGYDSTDFDVSAAVSGGAGTVIDAQQTTAQRVTVSGTLGYAFELYSLTLTPMVGLSTSRTRTGSIHLVDLGGRLDIADRDTLTRSAGVELSTTLDLPDDSGSLRYSASGMYYAEFGDSAAFTYSDDVNGSVELAAEPAGDRGVVSLGVSYEATSTVMPGTVSLGAQADLTYSGAQLGSGFTVRAGMSF